MKKVAIIIVNWNGKDNTVNCLNSLKQADKHKNISVMTVVVDNGSADDSVAVIRKNHSGVMLLETGKNLGFTGGNNFGIKYALDRGTDYFWLLNNDTVVDKSVFTLVDAFKDNTVGIAGSKI